jgi:hypothetical protein
MKTLDRESFIFGTAVADQIADGVWSLYEIKTLPIPEADAVYVLIFPTGYWENSAVDYWLLDHKGCVIPQDNRAALAQIQLGEPVTFPPNPDTPRIQY